MFLISHLFVLLATGVIVAKLIELLADQHFTAIARSHLIAEKVACYFAISLNGKHCPEIIERMEDSICDYVNQHLRRSKLSSDGVKVNFQSECLSVQAAQSYGFAKLLAYLPEDKTIIVFPDKIVFPDGSEQIFTDPQLVQLHSMSRQTA